MKQEKNCEGGDCNACRQEDSPSTRPRYPHSLPLLISHVKRNIDYSKVTGEWDLLFNVCSLHLITLISTRLFFFRGHSFLFLGDWNAIGT
jgi:hypothetical protein